VPRKTARVPRAVRRRRSTPAAAPPVRAGTRARNKEAKQRRIVNAALQLFQSRGFEHTTTREIARKAGIAEGTLFNYFPTKEDIALHFFEMEVDHAIDTVRERKSLRKAPLEEKLFVLVQTQLQFLAPYDRFIGTAFVEALKPSSRLGVFSHRGQALRHRYIAFVQELVEQSLPKKNLSFVMLWAPDAFWIYYVGVLLFWLNDPSPRKQNTLAFLDRTLRFAVSVIRESTRH
jgi:AcrR family transcriptional regulator